MSYQFIHIEDYGRVVSKKTKNNGSNDKYKKETRGRSVREIIAEAKREKGNCPHVENPKDPILLFGVGLDEVEKLAYEYHDNTKITDKNGKEKKLRSDANILLAGVVSLNKDNKDIWDDYKNDAIAYLSNKYGKKLVSVIEHTDEENPHFHFYIIQKPGLKFDLIHDGKKALYENKDKKKHDQNIAYLDAMRGFQEDFFKVVSSNYGLTKDGPKRARLSRSDYFKQSREVSLLDQVKLKATETGKKQGYSFAVDQFEKSSWWGKTKIAVSFKNSEFTALKADYKKLNRRKNHYKKKVDEVKEEISSEYENKLSEEYKKNKATSRNLYFTLNENQSLKEYKTKYEDLNKSFNETLEEQKKPLLEENNTLKTENQNLKTENTENKKQLEKYQEFFTRVKKYYGDRFSDFLEKIKPKTTIKPK